MAEEVRGEQGSAWPWRRSHQTAALTMINHPEQSYRYSRRPTDLYKIWMDLQEEEEEEEEGSSITADLQISDYQA